MSILDRLNLLIRSNLNDSLGRHGSGSARRALVDMEDSLRQARRRQAELRRGEKELIAQIRTARDKSDQWEERAMLALREGDEELAREALVAKNKALRGAQKLRDQLDDHRAHIQDIERALEALEHKLESTRNRMRATSSGHSRSSSRTPSKRIGDEQRAAKWDERLDKRRRSSTESPGSTDAFDTSREFREMDRMASKIDGMEAEIEAMRELDDIGGDSRRAELERIFRSMEGNKQRPSTRSRRRRDNDEGDSDQPPIDDDLADLKKKFE